MTCGTPLFFCLPQTIKTNFRLYILCSSVHPPPQSCFCTHTRLFSASAAASRRVAVECEGGGTVADAEGLLLFSNHFKKLIVSLAVCNKPPCCSAD
jgi:hypothetical protein